MKTKKVLIIFIVFLVIILLFFGIKGCQKKVTVTFLEYGDSNEVLISPNNVVSPLDDPVRDGYRFLGWYLDDELFDFDTPITEDITLVAKWEKIDYEEYEVKFIVDGEIVHSEIVDEGLSISMPDSPTKEGYQFLGWYYQDELFDFNQKIKKDMKLVAKFKKLEENSVSNDLGTPITSYPSTSSNSSNSNSSSVPPRGDVTPPKNFTPSIEVSTYRISIVAKTTDDTTASSKLKYYYSINNGAYQNSPIFTNLKANTVYTVSVKVVDQAGNVRIVKKNVRTKSIDVAEIEEVSPIRPTKNNVVIKIKELDSFLSYYSLDGKNWIESTDGNVVLSENGEVFLCYGDGVGNYGESISYQVNNIDRVAPTSYEPNIHITSNSIIVSGTTTDNMTYTNDLIYRYQLDGGSFQEEGTFENLTTGVHYLVVTVTDEAGNVLTIQKEVSVSGVENPIIKVDKTEITNDSVTLTLENDNDDYQLQYKREQDSEFKDCALPLEIFSNQTIVFRFTDGVNYSAEVVVVIDNIDRSKPTVIFDSNDTEYRKEQDVHFTVKDNVQISSIAYAISTSNSFDDVKDWITVEEELGQEKDMNITIDNKTGSYYVLVKVTDTAGNVTEIISPVSLLDNELPVVNLDKSATSTNSISIKVEGSDGVSGVKGYYYSCDGGKTFSSLQEDGVYIFAGLKNNTEYSIVVKIEDKAGNQAISKPISVTTNDFGVVSMTVGEDKWASQKTVSVSYQNISGETYYYKTSEDGNWQSIIQFPFEEVYVENGTFYFKVSDGTNEQISQFDINKIDPIVPEINNITTSDLDYNQVKLHVDAKDLGEDEERSEIAGYVYHCGNGIYSDLTTDTSYLCSNLTKETTYDMGVVVYDNAGNEQEKTISVTTLPKYEGIALPNTPEKLDGENYFKADQALDDYGFSVDSEEWQDNEYTLNLSPNWDIGGFWTNRGTITYTIQFKNDTQLPMTMGKIETSIVRNPLSYIKNASGSLEKETVMPGESVSITVSVNADYALPIGGQTVRAIATYMFQGEEKQFVFNINFL